MSLIGPILRRHSGGADYAARVAYRDTYGLRTKQANESSADTWTGDAVFEVYPNTGRAEFVTGDSIPQSNGYREMSINLWSPSAAFPRWDPAKFDLRMWLTDLVFTGGDDKVAVVLGLLSGSPAANRSGGAALACLDKVAVCGANGLGGSDAVTSLEAMAIEIYTDGGDSLFTHLYAKGSDTSGYFKPITTGGSGVTGFDRDTAQLVVGVGCVTSAVVGTEAMSGKAYFDFIPKPEIFS